MSTDIDYDELEALLAELEEPSAPEAVTAEEPVAAEKPVIELEAAEPAKRTRRTKKEMEEARAASVEPVEAVEPVEPVEIAEPEPSPEPVIEGTSVTLSIVDELDELEAAVEASPALEERYEEEFEPFVPESNLKTFFNQEKLKKDLDFSQLSLSNACMQQAAMFAHYSMMAHQAQFQADRASQQVELIEAQLDQKYRDAFTSAGTKVTESVIGAAITRDSKYQAAMLRKSEAKAIAEMVKSAADSFRHRRDMIQLTSWDTREERKGEMRIKEHPAADVMSYMRSGS